MTTNDIQILTGSWLVGVTLIVIAVTACSDQQIPDPVIPTDTDRCPAACERMRELGCEEGEPLPDGTPCEIFCADVQGAGFPLFPSCLEKIDSCTEIDDCATKR